MRFTVNKKKDKLGKILYYLAMTVLILSGVTTIIGSLADIPKVMFCGIGVFVACMFCAVINDSHTHYDDE